MLSKETRRTTSEDISRGRSGKGSRTGGEWAGCLVDGRTTGEKNLLPGRAISAQERVDNAEVRVMDRLPLPGDRIDETLIRVEWPDPTGKYTRPAARHDKSATDYA